jgi:opacity protein-like surface antigen
MSMVMVAGLLVPALAAAQEASETVSTEQAQAPEGGLILFGGRVGGIIPFGGLNPFVTGGIEAGYVFPWLNRSLAAAVQMDYTAPKQDGSQTDPRVQSNGGTYNWKLTEQQLCIMPVVMYRFTSLGSLVPYAGIGPRIYMLKSNVKGTVGDQVISETTEKSTKVGFGVPIGLEYALGPGAIIAELLLQYGGLDHKATGDTNTGGASLALGYRFLL